MPLVEESIRVKAPASEIFGILIYFENYPDFMEGVKEVKILERTENMSVSDWTAGVDGRVFKWVERDFLKPDENRIDFELVKGDLKTYGGFWQLEEQDGETNIVFNIHFELGMPMIAPLIHPLLARKLRENMKQMLSDIKDKVEKVGSLQ